MAKMAIKRIPKILASIGAVLVFTAQIGPKDAVSNLSEWFRLVGIAFPDWLSSTKADQYATYIGLILLVTALVAVFSPYVRRWCLAAKLEIRHSQERPYLVKINQDTKFYIGIYNHGPSVADNVKVCIDSITPRPKAESFRGELPYYVPTREDETQITCKINPGTESLFRIAEYWIAQDNTLVIVGLDGKDMGGKEERPLYIEPRERWEVAIAVTAANAASIKEKFIINEQNKNLIFFKGS